MADTKIKKTEAMKAKEDEEYRRTHRKGKKSRVKQFAEGADSK